MFSKQQVSMGNQGIAIGEVSKALIARHYFSEVKKCRNGAFPHETANSTSNLMNLKSNGSRNGKIPMINKIKPTKKL